MAAPHGEGPKPLLVSVAEVSFGTLRSFPMPCSKLENTEMEVTAANGSVLPGALCQLSILERGEVE